MNEPIEIHVVLTPSEEVTSLKNQLSDLNNKYLTLLADHKRTEYKYMCEVTQKLQIVDWLKENKVSCPQRFFQSPY